MTRPVIQHLIDGVHRPASDGATMPVIDPAVGAAHAELACGTAADVDAAVGAARAAFPAWRDAGPSVRAGLMVALADAIDARLDDFARAESIDNGKPIAVARSVDIPRAVANLRFFAGRVLHDHSEFCTTDVSATGGQRVHALNYVLRSPRGVAGCISPWNLPLYLFTWKIAPALATGNTVVAKPSEVTPLTASMLGELTVELGWPAGVLNIVHGEGPAVGQRIVEHPDIPAISFTGGTATGATIARTAAPMFKKLSLELGGKNPYVVFADADLDRAAKTAVRAAFANQGQICLCGSRMLVERTVYDDFVAQLVSAARHLTCGDPLEPATRFGALVSAAHRDKVQAAIDQARADGGVIACGGGPPNELPERCANGCFIEPTVITGLGPECAANQDEIFGPVVTVMPFDREEDAIAIANGTRYGLAASIWTRDLDRAHRVAAAVESGIIWINTWLLRDLRVPFGGMKESGVGREGGTDALRFFTEPRSITVEIANDSRSESNS